MGVMLSLPLNGAIPKRIIIFGQAAHDPLRLAVLHIFGQHAHFRAPVVPMLSVINYSGRHESQYSSNWKAALCQMQKGPALISKGTSDYGKGPAPPAPLGSAMQAETDGPSGPAPIFRGGMPVDPESLRYAIGCLPVRRSLGDLLAQLDIDPS